jgi:hypothetical protein
MNLITCKSAKEQGLDRYFTGKPCKHGHTDERRVIDRACVACGNEKAVRHYNRHREAQIAKMANWRNANRDKMRAASDNWKANNPEANRQSAKAYREEHAEQRAKGMRDWRDRNLDHVNAYRSEWLSQNGGLMAAHGAKRRAAKYQAAPNWLTSEHHAEIAEIYRQSQHLSASTGVPHHVDHIVPLQNKVVSGLHVPWNLRIITAQENVRKKNRLIPELINP